MGNCLDPKPKTPGKSEVKLLLLGSGECGKSTCFKQMKIIHDNGFEKEELFHYKSSIYANILHTIQVLSKRIISRKENFEKKENLEKAKTIIKIADADTSLLLNAVEVYDIKIAGYIKSLWNDKAIKNAFKYRYDYHVFDGAEYFFAKLDKLNPPSYVPTPEDVLRCRRKTTGLVSMNCTLNGVKINLFDVGGQRGERKKWIHCFDNVTCVIFVASLSDYDQRCYEDDLTNRMLESLDLFDEIINGKTFQKTPIKLFLNKTDVFKTKIKDSDLKKCFPNYNGNNTFEDASQFIAKQFLKLNKFDPDRIQVFYTSATDRDCVRNAFEEVSKTLKGFVETK